jgi:putative tricarboxylic transport membrane protein
VSAFEGLLYGLEVAMEPQYLLAALIGALAGTLLGILPGIGPLAGAAILLPLTFTMPPTASLIVIAAIYYGVAYGGSTTAILLNIPGEASSVVTAIDGYEMTKKGRAGPALGVTALASFGAAMVSVFLVALATPLLADVGLKFGPAEFFALTLGGLIMLSGAFSSRGLGGSMLPLFAGLGLGVVGIDTTTGVPRYTFGELSLSEGVPVVALALGVFAIAELLFLVGGPLGMGAAKAQKVRFRDTIPSGEDLRRSAAPMARGGAIGFIMGLMPGPSQTLSTFFSYRLEKSVSRNRDQLGTGAVEGIAGPEAANNAAATSSIVPLLALGLPFSGTLAFMLTALQVQGITPGPLLITQHPEIFWGVIASMVIGNIALLFLNLNLISLWVKVLAIPYDILVPVIIAFSVAGSYAARYIIADVWWIVPLAALGYVFRRAGMSVVPLLLGLILGPLIEKYFRQSMFISGGEPEYLVTSSAISAVMWVVVALAMVIPALLRFRARRRGRAVLNAEVEV